MKKLFLLISMLFTLSIICSANTIPLEQCAGGGYQPVGQCPTYNNYGGGSTIKYIFNAVAYDKNTGAYGSGRNLSRGDAKKEAKKNCGTENCKIIFSAPYGGVVISSNGIIVTQNHGLMMGDREKLLEKCEKKGGINCKVVFKF